MPSEKVPENLLSAYYKARYKLFSKPPIYFKIDHPSEELNKFLTSKNFTSASFLTAYNPKSILLSKETNQSRNIQLRKRILSMSINYIRGFGEDPNHIWPGEESFLVFPISLDNAILLGRSFNQNALVWIEAPRAPELITL